MMDAVGGTLVTEYEIGESIGRAIGFLIFYGTIPLIVAWIVWWRFARRR